MGAPVGTAAMQAVDEAVDEAGEGMGEVEAADIAEGLDTAAVAVAGGNLLFRAVLLS